MDMKTVKAGMVVRSCLPIVTRSSSRLDPEPNQELVAHRGQGKARPLLCAWLSCLQWPVPSQAVSVLCLLASLSFSLAAAQG